MFMTILSIGFILVLISMSMVSGQWQSKLWAICAIGAIAAPLIILFFFNWISLKKPDHNGNRINKIK